MKAKEMVPGMVYTDRTGSHFIVCQVKTVGDKIHAQMSAGRTDPGVWVELDPEAEVDHSRKLA